MRHHQRRVSDAGKLCRVAVMLVVAWSRVRGRPRVVVCGSGRHARFESLHRRRQRNVRRGHRRQPGVPTPEPERHDAPVQHLWLAQADVSTTLTSVTGGGFAAERAMWWPDGAWYEAHASLGSRETSTRWAVPDALEGGPLGSQTYVPVSNAAAAARLRHRSPDGSRGLRWPDLVPQWWPRPSGPAGAGLTPGATGASEAAS
jgi:hypothetical protein